MTISSLSVNEVKPEFLLSENEDQKPVLTFNADERVAFISTATFSEVNERLAAYLKHTLSFSCVYLLQEQSGQTISKSFLAFQSTLWRKVYEKGLNVAVFVIGDVANVSPIAMSMADPKKYVVEINYGESDRNSFENYTQTSVLEPILLLNRLRNSDTLSEALHMPL